MIKRKSNRNQIKRLVILKHRRMIKKEPKKKRRKMKRMKVKKRKIKRRMTKKSSRKAPKY